MEDTLFYSQLLHIQKMEALGKLSSGVIHEINNYLATIMGNCEIVKMKLGNETEIVSRLEAVIETSFKASKLLRELLAFSKSGPEATEIVNINEIVMRMKEMVDGLIGEHIRLELVLEDQLANVKADPTKIEQVILNLVINSKDAMPTGGVITIETANVEFTPEFMKKHHVMSPGDYVMLAVTDTGIGIPDEIKDKVFKPFFTTKDVGKGSGLGLSTVYGIVKGYQGYVWLYSEVGKGTTMKVYLPAVGEVKREKKKSGGVSFEDVKGTGRVLVIEDNEGIRETTKEVLETAGYEVVTASTGEEALELFEKDSNFDLLLTDVILPGMNGREVMERLREKKEGLKVIFMSGYTDGVLFCNGILYKGLNFIQKPFTSVDLLKTVRDVLEEE